MADIDKLFEQISSEILTEQTKLEMSVLFENSLTEAIKAKEDEIEKKNKSEIKVFKESIVDKIDSYLDIFVEEFISKNTIPIEESVKMKTAEKVLKTFKNVISDFHLQLDEKKIDSDDALKEAKEEINRVTKKLIEAKKDIKTHEKAVIVMQEAMNLETELQKSKLVSFAKTLPKDELFEGKIKAQVKIMLSESKQKETPKRKLEMTEDKEIFVEKKSVVDTYISSL